MPKNSASPASNEIAPQRAPAPRNDTAKREQSENIGGQDSRDQSTEERHSVLGSPEREDNAEATAPTYASDTRDGFSRKIAELQKKGDTKAARGGEGYDGNWTRDTDKPPQPGPTS